MTDLEQEILSRGNWWVVIHPHEYEQQKLPIEDLEPILRRARVQLRGWDFPHIGDKDPIRTRLRSITGSTDWRYYREVWRFYQSGQFSYLLAIHEDWIEKAREDPYGPVWGPPEHLIPSGPLLGVGDTINRLTEIFEFASRLAVTPAGGETMHLSIAIRGLEKRLLWVDSPGRYPMQNEYRAEIGQYPFQGDVPTSELNARARELAADLAKDVFARFGWHPPLEMLKKQQAELRTTA